METCWLSSELWDWSGKQNFARFDNFSKILWSSNKVAGNRIISSFYANISSNDCRKCKSTKLHVNHHNQHQSKFLFHLHIFMWHFSDEFLVSLSSVVFKGNFLLLSWNFSQYIDDLNLCQGRTRVRDALWAHTTISRSTINFRSDEKHEKLSSMSERENWKFSKF